MAKPLVAIVGRPNVGKSMLFNKLTGHRTAIVEDTPGVTRDRIYGECDWNGRDFMLVDTGGIEPSTDSEILLFMRRQAEIAIETADVIIMVTDVHTGVTAADQDIASMLLRSRKPVCLAVNKCDSVGPTNPDVYEFYSRASGTPSRSRRSTDTAPATCWTAVLENIPEDSGEEEDERRYQGRHRGQAQRRQVQPVKPYPRRGTGHRLRRGRHHPGRHRLLF